MSDKTGADLDANPNNRAFKTYTGITFDLFDDSTWEFDRLDIARPLSNMCRFAGHIDFRSVATHCVDVVNILREWGCPPDVQLAGLLHDASEAYLLDIPRPWKGYVSIGDDTYYELEERLEDAIFDWAGPAAVYARTHDWDLVKEADMASYEKERASRGGERHHNLPFIHPNAAMNEFLFYWDYLNDEVAKAA